MRFAPRLAILACSLVVGGACNDGGSGLQGDAQVRRLSPAETRTLCEWSTALAGTPGTMIDCDDGVSVTLDSVDDCIDELSFLDQCEITVGEVEACARAAAQKPCTFGGKDCEPLFECFAR